jgi:hypothetical protein
MVPAIQGHLAVGRLVDGQFEEMLDYPRTAVALGLYELGHVPEITPCPDAGPAGQPITHAAIFASPADDATALLSFPLIAPYTVAPAHHPTFAPRLNVIIASHMV